MAFDAGPRGTGVAFGLIDDAEIAALQDWTEPKSFRRGMFAGKTMRLVINLWHLLNLAAWFPQGAISKDHAGLRTTWFKLEMAQGPLHGRRKTDKDRRPLSHVPIARLRVKECWRSRHHDGWDEEELDIANIDGTMLVCAADISGNHGSPSMTPRPSSAHGDRMGPFSGGGDMQGSNKGMVTDGRAQHHRIWVPAPDPSMRLSHLRDGGAPGPGPGVPGGIVHPPPPRLDPREQQALSRADLAVAGPGPSSLAHRASWTGDSDFSRGMYMVHEAGQEDWDDMQDTQLRAAGTVRRHKDDLSDGGSSDDGGMMSRHYSDRRAGKRIRTQNARNLYGSLHVSGVKVLAPEGGMGLWFLFTDLCVRYEGTFRLRIRCFDLSSVEEFATTGEQFLAQAFSGLFKVYSPRNFPGLPKQTELSEHFSRQGFKLNTRKNERQIKTPPPASSSNRSVSPKKPSIPTVASAPPSYGRDRGDYDSDRDRRDRDWEAGRKGGRDRPREWDLDGFGLDRVPRLPGGQPAPPPALAPSASAPPPPPPGSGSSSAGPGGHYRVHSGSMPRDGAYEYSSLPLPPPPPPAGSVIDHRYTPGPHGPPPPGGPSPMSYPSHPHSHPSSAHGHSHPYAHPHPYEAHSHSLPPPPIPHLPAPSLGATHSRSGSTSASARSPYGGPSSHAPLSERDRGNGYPTAQPLVAEGSATRRSFEQMKMGPPFSRGVAAPAAAPPPPPSLPPLATPPLVSPVGGPGFSPLAGPPPPPATGEHMPSMPGPGGSAPPPPYPSHP